MTATDPDTLPSVSPVPVPPAAHAAEGAEAVAAMLGVTPTEGLSSADASRRLEAWGPNRLDEPPPRPPWLLFLDQFRNLLVLILIGAAVEIGRAHV